MHCKERFACEPLLAFLVAIAAAGCAGRGTVVTPPPATTSIDPSLAAVAPVTLAEAPSDWQLLDEATDHVPGIGMERARRELLRDKKPQRNVLVAIIDDGVDTAHADLRASLWTNPNARSGGRPFQGDVHGWDFIGGGDGRDIQFDTGEETREYARCHGRAAASGSPPITDAARCAQIDAVFLAERSGVENTLSEIRRMRVQIEQAVVVLKHALGTDSLTVDGARALVPSTPAIDTARQTFLQHETDGPSLADLDDFRAHFEGQLQYRVNADYDPRPIVGDHYTDLSERAYGNPDVMGPNPRHGTHVAGIVVSTSGGAIANTGTGPAVRFMMIRTVPAGDERDKDVANAIRYAVDNGAQVISMSFGKAYSPNKAAVDDAVRYADARDVLMVHAAGNDGAELSAGSSFPSAVYLDGTRARNWIEVGASSWKGGDSLIARFSNYGQHEVDVFAPGVDILSSVPGNAHDRMSGTSMATPVVSGLAALLMAYYPSLTATDVRRIILESASRYSDQLVLKPRDYREKVPFGSLSVTGGIVNAYDAIRMADQVSRRAIPLPRPKRLGPLTIGPRLRRSR